MLRRVYPSELDSRLHGKSEVAILRETPDRHVVALRWT
jgi:hypothetical protein